VDAIQEDDQKEAAFLKACLTKLGLTVNQELNVVPSLSRLHLSSLESSDVQELVNSWKDIVVAEEGEEYIRSENDTFHLGKPSRWSMSSLATVLPILSGEKTNEKAVNEGDRILDYSTVVKQMIVHKQSYPSCKETPYFNHQAFYANLRHYQSLSKFSRGEFGKYLMYGEVVTSTNTMLEK
jgi:biotin---protein ligase